MPLPLTAMLGIDLPVCQAPIGSAATPALAAAVANAGGLGMLALSWASTRQVARQVRDTRARAARPFGVNFVLEWPQLERLQAALAEGVRIVSTFWGNPREVAAEVHRAGGLLIHTVGCADEAAEAIAAGADAIVAQGVEAGGHVRGTTPLHDLLAALRGRFPGTPVLAAGGIGSAADVAAARAAGAAGVWVGTRFVCAEEADAADIYKAMLVRSRASDTVLTQAFWRGWPAPHRVLRNSTVTAWEHAQAASPAAAPPSGTIAWSARGQPIERHAFALPTAGMTGDLEAMALYAGTGVDRIDDIVPARTLVQRLAAGL